MALFAFARKKEANHQEEIQDTFADLSSLQDLQIASAFLFPSNTWRKTPCSVEACVNNNSQNGSFKTRRINFRLHIFQKPEGSQLPRYTFRYRKSSTNVKAFKTVCNSQHTQFSHGLHIWHINLLHRLMFPQRD